MLQQSFMTEIGMFEAISAVLSFQVARRAHRAQVDYVKFRESLHTWYNCGPWRWRVVRFTDGWTYVQYDNRRAS